MLNLLAILQPFQRNQRNQRNQRKHFAHNNVFSFRQTRTHVTHVRFVFSQQNNSNIFCEQFFGLYRRFKVIFVSTLNSIRLRQRFFCIFESKTRIIFIDLKRIDCEPD